MSPLTIADAEDAYLSGKADFEQWQELFTAQWYEPLGRSLLSAIIGRLSPEERTALRQMNPEAYDEVIEMIGGTNASTRTNGTQKSNPV